MKRINKKIELTILSALCAFTCLNSVGSDTSEIPDNLSEIVPREIGSKQPVRKSFAELRREVLSRSSPAEPAPEGPGYLFEHASLIPHRSKKVSLTARIDGSTEKCFIELELASEQDAMQLFHQIANGQPYSNSRNLMQTFPKHTKPCFMTEMERLNTNLQLLSVECRPYSDVLDPFMFRVELQDKVLTLDTLLTILDQFTRVLEDSITTREHTFKFLLLTNPGDVREHPLRFVQSAHLKSQDFLSFVEQIPDGVLSPTDSARFCDIMQLRMSLDFFQIRKHQHSFAIDPKPTDVEFAIHDIYQYTKFGRKFFIVNTTDPKLGNVTISNGAKLLECQDIEQIPANDLFGTEFRAITNLREALQYLLEFCGKQENGFLRPSAALFLFSSKENQIRNECKLFSWYSLSFDLNNVSLDGNRFIRLWNLQNQPTLKIVPAKEYYEETFSTPKLG